MWQVQAGWGVPVSKLRRSCAHLGVVSMGASVGHLALASDVELGLVAPEGS